MSQIQREYNYKPGWIAIPLAGGLSGLGAVMMGYAATTNDRMPILNGILKLSTPNA